VERVLAIAAGGALGSVLRWSLQGAVQRLVGAGFPWGTFAVNVAGGFAIGFLATLVEERGALGPAARAGLLVGVLGGFTTFSTYLWESHALLRDGRWAAAAANVAGSTAIGLVAVAAGIVAARVAVSGVGR